MNAPDAKTIAFVLLLLAGPALSDKARNLVPNPGFEEGRSYPSRWDPVDGLCTFWVEDPVRGGKCLKCDSDVLASEYRARQEEMKQPNPPPAKPKTPVKPPGYNAVGGIEGVTYWSDWMDVKPRMRYRMSVDFRTDEEFARKNLTPKVFVKGYAEVPEKVLEDGKTVTKTFRRVFFKKYKNCQDCEPSWKTAILEFNPTRQKPEVKWMRVMIMAYWPRGTYYFDNVRVEELGEDTSVPKPGETEPDEEELEEGPADQGGPELYPPK